MSSILIREYDKTKAGINSNYANFSVVVPGYSFKENINEDVFDENGIYECSSQKDFYDKVGLGIKTTVASEGVAPVFKDEEFAERNKEVFDSLAGKWYTRTAWTAEEKAAGKNVNGYLKDVNYHYDLALVWESGVKYNWIQYSEQRGKDAVVACTHYGNQIAYYLLGLGYTVLYKKITDQVGIDNAEFWEPLKDKSVYDFRYVIHGLLENCVSINKLIAELATYKNNIEEIYDNGRGDCVALYDVDYIKYKNLVDQKEIINAIKLEVNSYSFADKYSAIFANPITYNISVEAEFAGNKTFPAYFHYLVCNAKSLENFAEWYAVSGYTRGVCNWSINYVAKRLGDYAIQALQPRNSDKGINHAINLIVKIKNNIYLWGNRTAHALDLSTSQNGDLVASHFLNIRQLCTSIKKQLYITCRRYTFDPNTDTLWFNFVSEIKPLLERMKADQGIRDYKLIKDKSNNQKAKLKAILRIVPIEAVEDFEINMYLEDSIDGSLNVIADEE